MRALTVNVSKSHELKNFCCVQQDNAPRSHKSERKQHRARRSVRTGRKCHLSK
jgi:hypothetical protein